MEPNPRLVKSLSNAPHRLGISPMSAAARDLLKSKLAVMPPKSLILSRQLSLRPQSSHQPRLLSRTQRGNTTPDGEDSVQYRGSSVWFSSACLQANKTRTFVIEFYKSAHIDCIRHNYAGKRCNWKEGLCFLR